MPKLTRDSTYEREWLAQVARSAGVWGHQAEAFADAVYARLHKGAEEYGNEVRPVDVMLHEAAEECEDIPGWNVLAAQFLTRADEVDDDARAELQALLIESAAHAFLSWMKQREAVHVYRVAAAEKKHARAVAVQGLFD